MTKMTTTPAGLVSGADFDFAVPAHRLGELSARFEKLARRADRIGVAAPGYRQAGTGEIIETNEITGARRVRQYALVVITGETVQLPGGWEFIGTVEHTDAGNLLLTVPGFVGSVPSEYRTDRPTCDHCRKNIARKFTFIVRDESGTFQRVGRTCTQSYLGIDPKHVAALATFLRAVRVVGDGDDLGGWGTGPRSFEVSDFLCYAAALVRLGGGYKSRSKFQHDSTADTAIEAMFPSNFTPGWLADIQPQECDAELSAKVLSWAREIPADTPSDYLSNVRIGCALQWMEHRHAGVVASAISSFVKHAEREAAKKAAPVLSEYFAPVSCKVGCGKLTAKDRRNGRAEHAPVVVTLTRKFSYESDWGMVCGRVFRTEAGHELVWFGSNDAAWALSYDRVDGHDEEVVSVGDSCTIGFTVKKHGEDRRTGTKQTIITRVARMTTDAVAAWHTARAPKVPKVRKSAKAAAAPLADSDLAAKRSATARKAVATRAAKLAHAAGTTEPPPRFDDAQREHFAAVLERLAA